MAALSSLAEGFSPLAKGLAGLLVLGGAATSLVPNARLVLGLVSARAFTRPHTLLTCAFAGDLLPVREASGSSGRQYHLARELSLPAGAVPTCWLCRPNPLLPLVLPFMQSLVYAAAAAFLVRIVEPLHGARELVKYLAATIILTAFATVCQPAARSCACLHRWPSRRSLRQRLPVHMQPRQASEAPALLRVHEFTLLLSSAGDLCDGRLLRLTHSGQGRRGPHRGRAVPAAGRLRGGGGCSAGELQCTCPSQAAASPTLLLHCMSRHVPHVCLALCAVQPARLSLPTRKRCSACLPANPCRLGRWPSSS